MTVNARSRHCTPLHAAFLAVAAAALCACDPPPAEELILGVKPAVDFDVERVLPARGEIRADSPIVIRFTRDVDTASVGSRSIRVTRADGRHPLRVRAWGSGRELRVAPLLGRSFPVGEPLLLHVDGAPSPRALRSAAGEPLAHRFEVPFQAGPAKADLTGPRLLASTPRDGAADVAPGTSVELRFSEPLARGAINSGDGVTLRVDGAVVATRLELSGDATMLVVRPSSPLPPDRRVEVELKGCLLDVAGNPIERGSAHTLGFHTSATSLHELAEDFVDGSKSDARATSCGWDDPEVPGVLVARSGSVRVAADSGTAPLDLGDAPTLHFQILVPAADVPAGLASALHLEFAVAPGGAQVLTALVEAGPSWLDTREPTFAANRSAADLRTVARVTDPVDIETGSGPLAPASADVVFEEPLRLTRGQAVLLDVRLLLSPGTHIAAYADAGTSALVEGHNGVAPAASLLVSPSVPQARSLWYDTGVAYPGWRPCSVVRADNEPSVRVIAEFQSAPPDEDGSADAARASPWETDLARLPAYRFVRFRLRFDGAPEGAFAPRIDRIVLPYER